METQTTLADFITRHGIEMSADVVDSNPNIDMSEDWAQNASHYKCVFTRRNGKRLATMTTYFSQGSAHHSDPKADAVLDCLSSDASSVDQQTFEGWANDMGYDSDSRKAEKIYKACEHGAKRLQKFLGADLYRELLYNTERL